MIENRLQDALLTEKMREQMLLNGSLDMFIGFIENPPKDKKVLIMLFGQAISHYEKLGFIVPYTYKDKYKELNK